MAAGSVASFTRKTDAQLLIDLSHRSRQHKQAAVSWLVSGACAAQKDAGGKDKSRGKGTARGHNRSQSSPNREIKCQVCAGFVCKYFKDTFVSSGQLCSLSLCALRSRATNIYANCV